tara:strand:- start:2465 stop:3817 length:1353 start_codon:yes stop_codon:yes gene_type:complete
MNINLNDILKSIKPILIEYNYDKAKKYPIKKISIDSRDIDINTLFIAIKGQSHDGHDYIHEALEKGSVAIISSKNFNQECPNIIVKDTVAALGLIASYLLDKISPSSIIGITGTNGKTSVTNIVYNILSTLNPSLKTFKNYNNLIGLPLSIFNTNFNEKHFILEMGASKSGDINDLIQIAKPNIVALLNASEAHLDTFKDIDNIVNTKGEILSYQGFPKTVILNRDDKFYEIWLDKSKHNKIVTISMTTKADYYLISSDKDYINIRTKDNQIIKLINDNYEPYIILNLLFSIAITMEAGANLENIIEGINSTKNISGRFNMLRGENECLIIDSTYNANPESFKANIDSLVQMNGTPWLIMGDMGELGDMALNFHAEIASYAKYKGVEKIFIISKYSDVISNAFGENSHIFNDKKSLINFIKPIIQKENNILIKASRFMNFEIIVDALTTI